MKYQNIDVYWPLELNIIRRSLPNHTFGLVRKDAQGKPRNHQGWDFYAEPGTDVWAVALGKVVRVTKGHKDWGNAVLIKHTDTFYTFYAHLTEVEVELNDEVDETDIIGTTGNTGNAKSMKGLDQHLHFEVRTQLDVGLGLDGRISPLAIFGKVPYTEEP